MISAQLADVARKVNQETPGAVDTARLSAYQIGKSRVAFAVRRLTNQQLADTFAGKIRTWNELGGDDREIIIIAGLPGDGLRTMVED